MTLQQAIKKAKNKPIKQLFNIRLRREIFQNDEAYDLSFAIDENTSGDELPIKIVNSDDLESDEVSLDLSDIEATDWVVVVVDAN